MKLPPEHSLVRRWPYRARVQARIADALLVLAIAAAIAATCYGASGGSAQQNQCRIDPNTGQVIPGSCDQGSASGMPSMYGINYLPIGAQQPWQEPRVVKLRNTIDGERYFFQTGSVVSIGGDSSYLLSCGHGLGEPGDPVLVIFNDGRTLDIAKVVDVDRAEDCSLLKLLGGPRQPYFEIAELEPAAGEKIFGGGFIEGGPWGGGYGTIDYFDGQLQDGRQMSCAMFEGTAFQGQSGGPVVTMNSQLCGVIHSTDPQLNKTLGVRWTRLEAFLDRHFPNRRNRLHLAGPETRPPATNDDWRPATPQPVPPASQPSPPLPAASNPAPQQPPTGGYPPPRPTPSYPPPPTASNPPPIASAPPLPTPAPPARYPTPPINTSTPVPPASNAVPPASQPPSAVGGFFAGLAGAPWLKVLGGAAAIGAGVGLPAAGVYAAKSLLPWAAGALVRRRVKKRWDERSARNHDRNTNSKTPATGHDQPAVGNDPAAPGNYPPAVGGSGPGGPGSGGQFCGRQQLRGRGAARDQPFSADDTEQRADDSLVSTVA